MLLQLKQIKDNISDDPYTELLKDVDSLDRYLHGVSTEGSYATRCLNVLKELSIDVNEG